MRRLVPALLAAPLLLAAALPASAQIMRDGLWEMSVSMEIPGMPPMPGATMKQCLTKADVEDPSKAAGAPEAQDCKVLKQAQSGNSLSYEISCNGGTTLVKGEMTGKGDSYSGRTQITTKEDGEVMTMVSMVKGRRLGDCK